jgi:outer membrane protein assembly factor BamA
MNKIAVKLILVFITISSITAAQTDTISKPEKKDKIKKGWTFGALPVVAYDADMGFQYGALAQFFDYGDGTIYPEYRQTFYIEVSRFTKGSGVNQLFYDSKYLIPGNIRITADLDYLTERALDFYGFNGYEANYEQPVTDESSDDYISRVYYKHERFMLRAMADFQGRIIGEKLRWLAGINYFNIKTATVDIERMNKGKKEEKQLPDTTLLYDEYVKYGLISEDEKDGGSHAILKVGLIYDTRDNEAAPNKGIWSEVLVMACPAFMSSSPKGFTQLAIAHRQFFTLFPKFVLAYRLAYQGTIAGTAPFYIQPYLFTSYALTTKPDGLGGSRTIRGVMRNRVVGDGAVNANLELRYKIWKTYLFKQNFYLGLVGFFDAGMVVQDRPVNKDLITENLSFFFDSQNDRPHYGTGLGLRAALNENFIIAVDYGFALDKRDGTSGLYIGISHIF